MFRATYSFVWKGHGALHVHSQWTVSVPQRQMKRRTVFIGLSALVILLLIGGIAVFFWANSLPDTANLVPESPVIVDLVSPLNGDQLDPGENIAVKAQAMSVEPLTHLELWVDGQLFAQKDVQSKAGEVVQVTWIWRGTDPGPHTFVVRAADAKGDNGQSTQVVLNMTDAKLLTQLPAVQGQSLNAVAAQFDLPAVQVAAANPGIDPTKPLKKGQTVNLPPPVSPAGTGGGTSSGNPAPPSGPTQQPGNPLSPLSYWFDLYVIQHVIPQQIPNAPALAIAAQNCKAQLFITAKAGNPQGFVVYRWSTGDQDFQKVAALGPKPAGTVIKYEDPTSLSSDLNYQYYVSAFNASGQNPGTIVGLKGASLNCPPTANSVIQNIKWNFTSSEPVNQSYCYQSSGDGSWQRVPKEPFQFFPGAVQDFQSQLLTTDKATVQLTLDCWGWQGGTLKYLGQGQTSVDVKKPPSQITVSGTNFKLTGTPQTGPQMQTMSGGAQCPSSAPCKIAAPHGLRQTTSAYECASHQDDVFAKFLCDQIINHSNVTWDVLVWEWSPPSLCWPNTPCPWVSKIDGYQLWLMDSQNQSATLVKTINDPNLKMAAFDSFPWAGQCYAIRAFANTSNGVLYSPYDNYCKEPAASKTLDLTPDHVLTTVTYWTSNCGFNQATGGENVNSSDFDFTKEILVGDDGDTGVNTDCDLLQHNYDGGVHFNVPPLPANTSFQKATLNFDLIKTGYAVASDVAVGHSTPLCANDLRLGNEDWTNWDPQKALIGEGAQSLYSVSTPYTSLSSYGVQLPIDVSDVVYKWLQNPASNHGFIFLENGGKLVQDHIKRANADEWACWNILGNFHLKIQYYAVP